MRRRILLTAPAIFILISLLTTTLIALAAGVVSEFQVTTDVNTQWRPMVYDRYVVWQDQRNGNADIYGYDLSTSTEFPISTNFFNQEHPTIYGDTVVWYDWRNGNADIYGYSLSGGTEFPITLNPNNQRLPVIWGDYVVWNDWRNGNWDVYGYQLSTSTEFPITVNAAHQYFPRTGGNYAVWWDERNGMGNWDIYGYNFATSTEFPICLEPGNQGYPAVHGNIVAWIDDRNGNWDIYGYNIATGTEFPIVTDPADQFRPWVSYDLVTWFDMRNGNQDIYGYRISTGEEFQITTDGSDQRHPAVHCEKVLWHDRRDGDYNIYGATVDFNFCGTPILPDTGFAPRQVQTLPLQPASNAYSDTAMVLEIPSLNVSQPIVGVPQTSTGWNVTWLDGDIGYLNGTAFPTWTGNTALTGHVYEADGEPGPFVDLGKLLWGREVYIHAWGMKYIYEVRSISWWTDPEDISAITRHEDYDWITLITCRRYDEKTDSFKYRTVVRAVLVGVESE
ncbi:MAG TPA: sortase [Anaerolineae bacterium]|nr:sortase [Anaerolineae bacterium]